MVLCFGTYASILKCCCPDDVINRALVSAIVASIDPDNRYGDKNDNTSAFRLLTCQANFPHLQYDPSIGAMRSQDGALSCVVALARSKSTADVAEEFDPVLNMMDADMKKAAVGALFDLIRNDASLEANRRETFAQCMGTTAAEIVTADKVNLRFFLAGLFLYTVLTNENTTPAAKSCVAEIREGGFIDQYRDFEIEFISDDDAQAQIGETAPLSSAPVAATVTTEASETADTVATESCITDYLAALKDKYNTIKTLLYYEEPHPFYDFYVCNTVVKRTPTTDTTGYPFRFKEIENATPAVIGEMDQYPILAAYGGMGKSMMMRHFLLTAVNEYQENGKIPVFIQLKDYQGGSSPDDLLYHIYNASLGVQSEMLLEQFIDLLNAGRILVLLDGLDELGSAYQADFETALDRFIDSYPGNQYVMSSRPFTDFISYGRFTIWHLSSFSNEQALELIDKLEFRPDDPTVKEKFVQALNDRLFETHHDFVSNPLLLTIMLMTFGQIAEVSPRMHIFYRDAYAVLSQKHDASKGAFKRQLKTGLSSEQFADYFAEFCARSYTDEKYEMTEDEAKKYFYDLNERRKHPEMTATATDFLYDLCANMCLMFMESGKYHFTHRSFQEYFCALFFSKQKDKNLQRIGDFFEKKRIHFFATQTFEMLYDMIPEKVEEYIFMPYLDSLIDACEKGDDYWTYLEQMYPRVYYSVENGVTSIDSLDSRSFIGSFISQHIDTSWNHAYIAEVPRYEQFLENQLVLLDDGDMVDIDELEQDYIDEHGLPEIVAYSYMFDIQTIRANPDSFKDLIEIIFRDDFPPMEEYQAFMKYRAELHERFDDEPENLFDYL